MPALCRLKAKKAICEVLGHEILPANQKNENGRFGEKKRTTVSRLLEQSVVATLPATLSVSRQAGAYQLRYRTKQTAL